MILKGVTMRIHVREVDGVKLSIPFPIPLMVFMIRRCKGIITNAVKSKNKKVVDYIDYVDYEQLASALEELGEYKGLKLVEITSENGDEIVIEI
jgi:hypothetical protein